MWFLDEREKTIQPKKQGLLLTTGVEYVIGRKDCTLLIQDDASISRKHSVITMLHDEAKLIMVMAVRRREIKIKLGDSSKISQVFLQDFSKYGTFVNGAKVAGTVTLKDGDEILFGKNNSYYRVRYTPLVVVTSCLDDKKKKQLKSHILKLGGHMISDWHPNLVTHLVMDELTFTIKVIHALAECCPVVTPSYFDDIANAASTSLGLAKVENYLPPLKEKTISSQGESFLPKEARRTLFSGKTFVFISKKQFKRVHHAVKSSGGIALLRDTPGSESDDGLVSKDVCVMMIDSKEQNALPADSQQWLLHVMETLRRHRCRPIPESELGLALLFMSLNKYCNPSITAVPPLTQSLVSQSFQAMDMSQGIAAHESQFKKPSTPVKHAKEDRNQGVWCEKQNLAFTTVQKSSKTMHFGKRCTSEDEVVESVPDSQTDSQNKPPSTKRRKVVEENLSTCLETPLVCESLDENKSPIGSHSNKQLEFAESIVAESLEVGHDVSIELNGQSKGKGGLHEQENKVKDIADSLHVSAHSDVAIGEAVGCDNKEEKTDEHSTFSVSEVQLNEKDRGREGRSKEKINSRLSHKTANKCDDEMEDLSDIHVPAGFLCSRIPTKLSRNTVFEDEEANLPRNLLVVDQVSLVARPFHVLPISQKRPEDTTIKNFKRFRKQFYPGSTVSLPRIIGGSDLVVYQSCERLDKEDWFVEAREADAERQKEERRAEELFRWEETRPTKSRRIRR